MANAKLGRRRKQCVWNLPGAPYPHFDLPSHPTSFASFPLHPSLPSPKADEAKKEKEAKERQGQHDTAKMNIDESDSHLNLRGGLSNSVQSMVRNMSQGE
jgi:hypothetical protein